MIYRTRVKILQTRRGEKVAVYPAESPMTGKISSCERVASARKKKQLEDLSRKQNEL